MSAIAIKDGITPSLQQLIKDFPEHLPKALADLGRKFRNEMAKQLRSGQSAGESLAPLNPITEAIKRSQAADVISARKTLRKSGKLSKESASIATRRKRIALQFGGELSDLFRFDAQPNSVKVGWLDNLTHDLSGFTALYQEARRNSYISKAQHRMLRLILGDNFKQPKTWPAKPRREVVNRYQAEWSGEAAESLRKSMLARIQNAQRKVA